MNNTSQLINYGQSFWLDNLSRQIIEDGSLKKIVSDDGLRGITSNPSIFQKAISKSDTYDQQIKELSDQGKDVQQIYEALTVKDVQDACDILKPVFEESKGSDGFVSLEVSPYLARDTQGSMDEARKLFKLVNRENCMIKIPGTKEGVPAIEEMLYEGININITLLFSLESYEAVANAYTNAMNRRIEENKPVDRIRSVASLFISRIDVLTDQLLGHYIIPNRKCDDRCPQTLLGKTGIVMAQLCYQKFKEIQESEAWHRMEAKGAKAQKLLWASTSTKNPLYKDVRYVNRLIAEDTINTLPTETIEDFNNHGQLKKDAIEENLNQAKHFFEKLKFFDIDIIFVTKQLENEGIQKFIDAYQKLMEGLTNKRSEVIQQKGSTQTINAQSFKKEFEESCLALDEIRAGDRLFNQDSHLWKNDFENIQSISERMGWLTSPEDSLKKVEEFTSFTENLKNDGFQYAVLLGMGGSSLCSEVAKETFQKKPGYLELLVLDNTAPEAILAIEKKIDLEKTLFIVASKSGGTVETINFFKYFYEQLKIVKPQNTGENFIAITDEGTNLVQISKDHNFRKTFINPSAIGGRYSVLSDFGIVPMALMGVDIKALLTDALQMKVSCSPAIPAQLNPGFSLGAILGVCQKQGRDKITFIQSPSISSFGYWVEQLIAESTGKEGKGLIPVNGETLGTPDKYGKDRVFVHFYLTSDDNSADDEKLKLIEEKGHPVIRIALNDKINLGGAFYEWEIAISIASILMEINPFDQPNVEESKQNTKEILSERGESGKLKTGEPLFSHNGIQIYSAQKGETKSSASSAKEYIQEFLNESKEGDYIALLPYLFMTTERKALLQSWRTDIRDDYKTATTLLAGPRYLHSTGQLHKGGPNSGLYIIITSESTEKLAIPELDYDFKTLDLAEALGDFKALNSKNRRVIRVHLEDEISESLKQITGKQ